ncbi:MAG: cyclic nucleotide-binding domain-containing protein [Bacteroidota bacterium]
MYEKTACKKGGVIQTAGEIGTKIYQVKSGLLRSYSIDAKGKEHIFLFAPEGWTIGDFVDSDSKAELYIDALEDSVVNVLEKDIDRRNKT